MYMCDPVCVCRVVSTVFREYFFFFSCIRWPRYVPNVVLCNLSINTDVVIVHM